VEADASSAGGSEAAADAGVDFGAIPPEKLYFRIGEVARIVGVKPYVLRYWETEFRSIKPEYLVVVGICTHLGCSPVDRFKAQAEPFESNWKGGFYCPCHGSLFDLAGRVYKNKPAPDNLPVPPHKYLSDTKILIGEDAKGA